MIEGAGVSADFAVLAAVARDIVTGADIVRTGFARDVAGMEGALSGWVGRSSVALARRSSMWDERVRSLVVAVDSHGLQLSAAAGHYNSADSSSASMLTADHSTLGTASAPKLLNL